jgi:hypothetical protein
MNEELEERAQAYAARCEMTLGQSLGSGIHGIVFRAKDNATNGRLALKFHADEAAYKRERDVYCRLGTLGVTQVAGFNVPQIDGYDDEQLVLAMTIVSRPFCLDFAAAYLDSPPAFSEETLALQEEKLREEFGERWPAVQRVLAALEEFGVFQIDASTGNIGFRD